VLPWLALAEPPDGQECFVNAPQLVWADAATMYKSLPGNLAACEDFIHGQSWVRRRGPCHVRARNGHEDDQGTTELASS
jgi:hypothetical protein